jgi:hypothetical protein
VAVSTQPISDDTRLPSILDIPADPFECLRRYIGLWDGAPKDEYEAALAALVAVRAERDRLILAIRSHAPKQADAIIDVAAVSSPGEETP